jgi:glycosyltransferase involved in cell wall biosynthesis
VSFSVLISLYKNESIAHLEEALTSIWDSQSVKPGEIVLVKDGPIGCELETVVCDWQLMLGKTLRIVSLSENKGLGTALNFGLDACKFDIVARMDTDDVALPERFKKQLAFLLDYPEVDILGSFVKEMSYLGDVGETRSAPVTHDDIITCLWASPMVHPSIMMRRSRVLEAGNYNPACRRRQDYELWFRCAEKGLQFHNLSEPLLYYRFGQHTHKKQPPKLAWDQAMIGYRGASRLGLPLIQRLACFLPFVRSLLPSGLQHALYRVLSPLDPRRRIYCHKNRKHF